MKEIIYISFIMKFVIERLDLISRDIYLADIYIYFDLKEHPPFKRIPPKISFIKTLNIKNCSFVPYSRYMSLYL